MSGAYVAKPAVESTAVPPAPDVPDEWDYNWPFPGMTDTEWPGIDPDPFFPAPHPPGYEPDYSLVMTATAEIAPDGAAAVTGSLRDHSTYATNEPTPIIWTATITSSPTRVVNLRFSGDEEYASGISSDCAFETYWGVAPNIEFELTDEDDGGIVTLTGTSSIGGVAVTQAAEVAIATAKYSVTITAIILAEYVIGYAGHVRVRAQAKRNSDDATIWGHVQYDYYPDFDLEQSFDALDEASVATNATGHDVGGDSIIITSTELNSDEIYDLYGYIDGYRCDVSGTVRILITEEVSETVVYDHTSNLHAVDLTGSPSDWHWVKIDTSDGTVTVVAD